MAARFEYKVKGDVVVLTAHGRITLDGGAHSLRNVIATLIKNGHKKIILNLSDTAYVDSAGIGTLVGSFMELNNLGGELVFLKLSERAKDLFDIIKLRTVFQVFDEELEALKYFES